MSICSLSRSKSIKKYWDGGGVMKECFKQTTRTEVTSMLKNAMERDFIQVLFPYLTVEFFKL